MIAKFAALVVLATAVIGANAESHTVTFDNRCGKGTVCIVQIYSVIHALRRFSAA